MSEPTHWKVRNFDKFQHYGKRRPPWIKLYAELLDDAEFCELADAAKWQLIGLFILASKVDNSIPNKPKWIMRQLHLDGEIDFDALKPWIIPVESTASQDASDVLAECKQSAMLETETETETEREREEEEERPKPNRGTRIPENFIVTADMREWARGKGLLPYIDSETEKFIDHWTAKAGKDGVKRDWVAAWRTWMRNAKGWGRAARAAPAKRTPNQEMLERMDARQGGVIDI